MSGRVVAVAIAAAMLVVAVAGSCERKKREGPYDRDVNRICDAVALAGAAELGRPEQVVLSADWLRRNLESQKARDFLVEFTQKPAAERSAALRAEAKRVGVTACPTADMWDELAEPPQ